MTLPSTARFPEHYAALPADHLLAVFAAAPQRLREVLLGLDEGELREHRRPGKWSIHEIVVHLADAEVVGALRMRKVWAEPGATLPVYDQDVWARRLDYPGRNAAELHECLDLFSALRRTSAQLLRRAGADEWQRSGAHPEWGELTLRQLLELYADHGERHIGQILELRRLAGKELDYPLLLEERLY